jgi:hypothetical protein
MCAGVDCAAWQLAHAAMAPSSRWGAWHATHWPPCGVDGGHVAAVRASAPWQLAQRVVAVAAAWCGVWQPAQFACPACIAGGPATCTAA